MKRLKKYLEDKKIPQTEFGRRLGVSQPTVSGWINGEIMPSAQTLIEMSNQTGMSIDEILDHCPPRVRSGASRKSV